MKPAPRFDFTVDVRRQSWEEEPEVADYYEGIFDVALNNCFSVLFVPSMVKTVWPPVLPDDADAVGSEMEARLISLALSRYAVTPDDALAGQEESFARQWSESGPGLVFYVTEAEFSAFSGELALLADQRPSVHSGWAVSEIADHAVAQFLVSRVAESKKLSPEDREMLAR